jgi:hypothetical protein
MHRRHSEGVLDAGSAVLRWRPRTGLPEAGGASLRAAGWNCIGEAGGGSWPGSPSPCSGGHAPLRRGAGPGYWLTLVRTRKRHNLFRVPVGGEQHYQDQEPDLRKSLPTEVAPPLVPRSRTLRVRRACERPNPPQRIDTGRTGWARSKSPLLSSIFSSHRARDSKARVPLAKVPVGVAILPLKPTPTHHAPLVRTADQQNGRKSPPQSTFGASTLCPQLSRRRPVNSEILGILLCPRVERALCPHSPGGDPAPERWRPGEGANPSKLTALVRRFRARVRQRRAGKVPFVSTRPGVDRNAPRILCAR